MSAAHKAPGSLRRMMAVANRDGRALITMIDRQVAIILPIDERTEWETADLLDRLSVTVAAELARAGSN